MKWIDEFRDGWRGRNEPSIALKISFSAFCLLVATLVRFGFSLIRNSDVPFSPYYPAILFATIFGGVRMGALTAAIGGVSGLAVNFGGPLDGPAKVSLFVIYVIVSGIVVWGAEHHRLIAFHYRTLSKKLTDEEDFRKLVVDELEHRLKNKAVSIQAVIYQILRNQPDLRKKIEDRIVALSSADALISSAGQTGSDLKDLLVSELRPYGHVRYILDGDRVHLPAKLAVSLALVFHELATNSVKYGAFCNPNGLLNVHWNVKKDRLKIHWDESGGPTVGPVGEPGFGTKLLKSALIQFDGKTETAYLPTGIICIIDCRLRG